MNSEQIFSYFSKEATMYGLRLLGQIDTFVHQEGCAELRKFIPINEGFMLLARPLEAHVIEGHETLTLPIEVELQSHPDQKVAFVDITVLTSDFKLYVEEWRKHRGRDAARALPAPSR
jgi:hypothetical protein